MWLINGPVNEALGENSPVKKKNKTPKDSDTVIVDVAKIRATYESLKKSFADSGLVIPFTVDHWIKTTVAHEIAHGIGVDLHGPSSDEPGRWIESGQDMFRIYAIDGTEIKDRRMKLKETSVFREEMPVVTFPA